MREIITINVGQCGIQVGEAVWKQYCAEHHIDKQGIKHYVDDRGIMRVDPLTGGQPKDDNQFTTLFAETMEGTYRPRNLMVDTESSVLDDVKTGDFKGLYHTDYLLGGMEDCGNNFARGCYTVGKGMMDDVMDRIRRLVDDCDNVQGFCINHSVGGGTGSGLGMLILERLAIEYRKKSKIGFENYPSPEKKTSMLEPYNALLSTHWLLDHTDVSLVFDNAALSDICKRKLEIDSPNYEDLNRIVAKVQSGMTQPLRFSGELNVDMNEFQTNLVPFPRLHFMTCGLGGLYKPGLESPDFSPRGITGDAFQHDSFLMKIPDFDVVKDKYMAIALNYSGEVKLKAANSTVDWLKRQNKVSFVEWCPTGFKIGLNSRGIAQVEGDKMSKMKSAVTMIGNNVGVRRMFQRYCKNYDMMYSQRAYVHWFLGEGMEEGQFSEARDDLGFLDKDYLDVVTEQGESEGGGEDDDF